MIEIAAFSADAFLGTFVVFSGLFSLVSFAIVFCSGWLRFRLKRKSEAGLSSTEDR
jgi:hypothetical protein